MAPEAWSRISDGFPFDYGRGLDAREGRAGGGTMEFNRVPFFEQTANNGTTYSRIPKLNFPVDDQGRSVLVQDPMYFSSTALADEIKAWRDGGATPTGKFNTQGIHFAKISTNPIHFTQQGQTLSNLSDIVESAAFDDYTFGLQWKDNNITPKGVFPEYHKEENSNRISIPKSEIPSETGLTANEFPLKEPGPAYWSPDSPSWTSPGHSSTERYKTLLDGSIVTYKWFKFVEQPAIQGLGWSDARKQKVQAMVEAIHGSWSIDGEYIPAPRHGSLGEFDNGLIVLPPAGMETGYVPIVTRQELGVSTGDCNGDLNGSAFLDACNICVGGNTGKSETVNGIPEDYIYLGDEGDTKTLPSISDVAYGHGCEFTYLFNVSGSVAINNGTFGDPAPGYPKKAYFKAIDIATSIDTQTTVSRLSIYPKHVQNQVNIEGRFSHWILTDVLGAVVKRGAEKVINVAHLNQGLYYLIIEGEVMKFIKI